MSGYNTTYTYDTLNLAASGETAAAELVQRAAARRYTDALIRAHLKQAWSALTGRPHGLLELSALTAMHIHGQSDAGTRAIPINRIRGSEGRSADFDASFDPLESHTRRRWISIATARLTGVEMPPIDVIQVGENYYVRDGHHRVSVAHAFGQQEIDAHITVWDVD